MSEKQKAKREFYVLLRNPDKSLGDYISVCLCLNCGERDIKALSNYCCNCGLLFDDIQQKTVVGVTSKGLERFNKKGGE